MAPPPVTAKEHSSSSTTTRRRRPGLWLALLAIAAFLVGLGVANGPAIGERVSQWLVVLGEPRLEVMQVMEKPVVGPDGVARTDWLLFFEDHVEVADRARVFAQHPTMQEIEPTIFDSGVVVSVVEPSGPTIEALRASPDVWLVLRDRPFYLCH